MASLKISPLILSGMLATCLSGCVGTLQQKLHHCETAPDCATPQMDYAQFMAISPIPNGCRRTYPDQRDDSTISMPPSIAPQLPPLVPSNSIEHERPARFEQRLQELTEVAHRHQQLIETAKSERSRIDQSVQSHLTKSQRDLADIRQKQSQLRLDMTKLSQHMTQLKFAQANDRNEQALLMDEIIHGMEQALSPGNTTMK